MKKNILKKVAKWTIFLVLFCLRRIDPMYLGCAYHSDVKILSLGVWKQFVFRPFAVPAGIPAVINALWTYLMLLPYALAARPLYNLTVTECTGCNESRYVCISWNWPCNSLLLFSHMFWLWTGMSWSYLLLTL